MKVTRILIDPNSIRKNLGLKQDLQSNQQQLILPRKERIYNFLQKLVALLYHNSIIQQVNQRFASIISSGELFIKLTNIFWATQLISTENKQSNWELIQETLKRLNKQPLNLNTIMTTYEIEDSELLLEIGSHIAQMLSVSGYVLDSSLFDDKVVDQSKFESSDASQEPEVIESSIVASTDLNTHQNSNFDQQNQQLIQNQFQQVINEQNICIQLLKNELLQMSDSLKLVQQDTIKNQEQSQYQISELTKQNQNLLDELNNYEQQVMQYVKQSQQVNNQLFFIKQQQNQEIRELQRSLQQIINIKEQFPDLQDYFISQYEKFFDILSDDKSVTKIDNELQHVVQEQLKLENCLDICLTQIHSIRTDKNNFLEQQYMDIADKYIQLEEQLKNQQTLNDTLIRQLAILQQQKYEYQTLLDTELENQETQMLNKYELERTLQQNLVHLKQQQLEYDNMAETFKSDYDRQKQSNLRVLQQLQLAKKESNFYQRQLDEFLLVKSTLLDIIDKLVSLVDKFNFKQSEINDITVFLKQLKQTVEQINQKQAKI